MNPKIFTVLKSAQIVLLALRLLALTVLIALVPQYSWIMAAGGSIYIIIATVITLAGDFNNKEELVD